MSEIDQMRAARRKMEAVIREAVRQAVIEFRSATGASPNSISIDMLRLDRVGQQVEEYVVGEVKAHVDL